MSRIMVTEHAVTRLRDAFRYYIRGREQEGNNNGSADPTGCMKLDDYAIRETCTVEVLEELAKGEPYGSYPRITGGEHDVRVIIYPNEHNKFPIPIYLLVNVDNFRHDYDFVVVTAMSESEYNRRLAEQELVDKIAEEKSKEVATVDHPQTESAVDELAELSPLGGLVVEALEKLQEDLCTQEVVVVLVSPGGKLDRAVGLSRDEATEFLTGVWGEYPPDRIRVLSLQKPKVQVTF